MGEEIESRQKKKIGRKGKREKDTHSQMEGKKSLLGRKRAYRIKIRLS